MPSCCSVLNCRSNKNARESIKVFQFPSDEKRRALWLETIPRTNRVPNKRSVVCIKHFKDEDVVKVDSVQRPDGSYLTVPRSNFKLKPDAVPCIFEPDKESPIKVEDTDDEFLEQETKENQNVEDLLTDDISSASDVTNYSMPFFWKPDNKRTQISPERMKAAVVQVVIEGRSIRSAAKEHRIDRKTLGRYVQKYRNTKDDEIELKPNYSSAQIFTDPEENLLEEYLNLAAEIHNGLTSKVARQIAYEHGIALKKILPDNWYATKCASYDWLRGFMHRHRAFSLRNPKSLGENEFSENYVSKNKYIAEIFASEDAKLHNSKLIADVNESGISGVQNSKFTANPHESGISSAHNSNKVTTEHTEKRVPSELQTVHDPECLLNTVASSTFTPFCTCQYKSENHVSITPINDVSIASLKNVSITPLNDVSITPLNDVSITPINDISITPINDVSVTPISDVAVTPTNDVSITPVNDVSNSEEIYILPTTDEPNVENSLMLTPEGTESDGKSTRGIYKRKREISPSHCPVNEETVKEQELKESRRTRRKRKL